MIVLGALSSFAQAARNEQENLRHIIAQKWRKLGRIRNVEATSDQPGEYHLSGRRKVKLHAEC